MCLTVTKNRLKSKFKNGRVILYKKLYLEYNGDYSESIPPLKVLVAPFMKTEYKPGWNEATYPIDVKSYTPGISDKISSGAIHVFTSKRAVHSSVDIRITVPVVCYKKDFIACGENHDACFTKVFLRKKDYDRAIKGKSI